MEPRGGVCGGRARGWRSRLQHAGRQRAGEIAAVVHRRPAVQGRRRGGRRAEGVLPEVKEAGQAGPACWNPA